MNSFNRTATATGPRRMVFFIGYSAYSTDPCVSASSTWPVAFPSAQSFYLTRTQYTQVRGGKNFHLVKLSFVFASITFCMVLTVCPDGLLFQLLQPLFTPRFACFCLSFCFFDEKKTDCERSGDNSGSESESRFDFGVFYHSFRFSRNVDWRVLCLGNSTLLSKRRKFLPNQCC